MVFKSEFIVVLGAMLFYSCSTPAKRLEPRPDYSVKVRYEDQQLKPAKSWLGGTEANPVYFTAQGERILTPLYDLYVAPVMKRSIDRKGKIIYPHMGFQLIGDMKLEQYISLINEVKKLDYVNNSIKPVMVYADSNFPEKGARVKVFNGNTIARYEYRQAHWHRIK